jgi:hypothetical protein
LHVDEGDDGHLDDDERDNVAEIDTDVVDAFAEAFNARDLDALLEVVAADGEAPGLLGGDRESLAEAVEGLWHRRPTCCVTRGRVDEVVVGVLWEHDGAAWWPLATVHVADLDDDGMVGVLEFSDDAALLDEVEAESPDGDLEEGSRWSEWDEGATDRGVSCPGCPPGCPRCQWPGSRRGMASPGAVPSTSRLQLGRGSLNTSPRVA